MLDNLKLYQLAITLISAVMIFFGLEKFFQKRQSQSLLKLSMHLLIWGGMAAVALFPSITDYLAHLIGLEGNINAVILLGFLLVFLMVFKILSVVERIEQDISTLTRQEALGKLGLTRDVKKK